MAFNLPRVLHGIVQRSFDALMVLIPFAALPWTVSPLEINKQAVFFAFAAIMIVAWLGEALMKREISLKPSAIWIPFALFLLAVAVSAGFSYDSYTSVFGQAGQEYTSAVTIALMMMVTVIGAHVLDAQAQRRLMLVGVTSSALIGLIACGAFIGLSFGRIPTNLIGTPNALAIYLLTMSILGCGAIIANVARHEAEKMLITFATITTVASTIAVLLAVDYTILWGLALLGSGSLFALASRQPELLKQPVRWVLPMLLCISSLFFLVLPSPISSPFPTEIALSMKATWNVTVQALEHGAWAIGTGPGTFGIDFTQYHSADLNTTSFWDTRFDRGSSALLTMIPTLGIFAFGALMVFFSIVKIQWLKKYWRAPQPECVSVTGAWVVIGTAFVFAPQNFVLTFLFWLFTAMMLHIVLPRIKKYSFSDSPRAGFFAAFSFVLCLVFVATVGFATVAKYRAEVAFAQAVVLDQQGGKVDEVIAKLDSAATVNRWSDIYYRNLGSALLAKVGVMAKDPKADPSMVKSLIGAAVNAGVRATELGPSNVVNWELRGDIYRNVSPLVSDAAQFAIASYQKAIELAPSNPKYLVDEARGYLALSDVVAPVVKGDDVAKASQAKAAQDDALAKADESLMSALSLKPDYALARYYLASVQEHQGKLAEAIASMELVRQNAPKDVGVGLQLAVLYLRQGKNDVAKNELQRIIAIAPNFANAHWYLASILEEEKDIDGAIQELNIILALDPTSDIAQKKLDALKAGKIAKTTPVPEPLPEIAPAPALPDAPTP